MTNAEHELIELKCNPAPIVAQVHQDARLLLLDRRTFSIPQADDFKIARENILGILPRVLQERFRREGATQNTIQDIILESSRYIRDEDRMKNQDAITQFAVSLFKDAAIPYALFSPRDIVVKLVTPPSGIKANFAFLKSMSFDAVRHSSCIDGWMENLAKRKIRFYIVK